MFSGRSACRGTGGAKPPVKGETAGQDAAFGVQRASAASEHAIGASRRSGERERV